MKIESYKFPESSFLSIEKDYTIIIDYILKNERLKKLLYYPYKDALNRPNLTSEQTQELLENNIKLIPKIQVDEDEKIYLYITFDNFYCGEGDLTNFADCNLIFDIVIHTNLYMLNDFKMRSYKIAAEINSMVKHKMLSNIGTADSLVTTTNIFDDYVVLSLGYKLLHFSEDKQQAGSPTEQQDIIDNFNHIFNK